MGDWKRRALGEQNHIFSTHSEPVFEESGVQGKRVKSYYCTRVCHACKTLSHTYAFMESPTPRN